MAIVRTTPNSPTGNGPDNGDKSEIQRPVDRTKSVVNQGGAPMARPTRTPGMINRPQSAPATTSSSAGPKAFIQDTLAELRRVVWPSKEDRAAGTVVTIGLLVFFALFIFGLDTLARELFVAAGILPPTAPR